MWDWLPHVAVLVWTATMGAWLLLGPGAPPRPPPPGRQPELPDAAPLLRLVRAPDGSGRR